MTEVAKSAPRMVAITIDCSDLSGMAAFWADLLGVEIRAIEGHFAFLTPPEGTGISVWLQHVPEARTEKTRIHVDLAAADLDASLDAIRKLGGTVGDQHEWHGYVWHQCFDPEGNVFDVMQAVAPPDSAD